MLAAILLTAALLLIVAESVHHSYLAALGR